MASFSDFFGGPKYQTVPAIYAKYCEKETDRYLKDGRCVILGDQIAAALKKLTQNEEIG